MIKEKISTAGQDALQTPSLPSVQLRAATAVCRDRGVSDVTLWRMGKRGWVRLVNIAGRSYVDMESLAQFDERARKGEFAKPPAGAALKSAQARAAREGQVETASAGEVA